MAGLSRFVALLLSASVLTAACSGGDRPLLESNGETETTIPSEDPVSADGTDQAPDAAPIVVGTLLDERNLLAPLDRQPGVAFAGAIDRLNQAGGLLGRPIEMIRVSSDSRLSVIDAGARRIVDAGAALLVVTCELDFATPALARAEAAGILVISPCAGEASWQTGAVGDLAFSMVAAADVYGGDLASLLWSEGNRTAAVLWDETSPDTRSECSGFMERWAQVGGATTATEPMNRVSAASLGTRNDVLAALEAADVVVLCAFDLVGTAVLRAVRQAGIITPIMAGLTMDNASFRLLDIEGLGDFRLLSFASPAGDDPSAAVEDAIADFERIDGIRPASGRFVLGADLALVWAAAVESEGTTEAGAIAAAIRSFDSILGASGEVSFDGTHVATGRVLRVMRHQEGRMIFARTWDG